MTCRTQRFVTQRVVLAVACAGGLLIVGAGTAQATSTKAGVAPSARTSAVCTLSADLAVSPGITMTPGTGTMTSGGPTGSMSCIGKVKGAPITARGTIDIAGRYGATKGDTCAAGVETGTGTITLPTAAGPVVVKGDYVVTRTFTAGTIHAAGPDGTLSGTLAAVPLSGTCLLSPLTRLRIVGPVTLTGP